MLENTRKLLPNYIFGKVLLGLFVFLLINIMISPSYAVSLCEEGKKQLRGDYERFQGDGGLWAQMERSVSLKEKSALGFQVDNKLMRIVVIYETRCDEGSQTNRSSESFDQAQDFLERGRKIHRTHMTKMDPKVFLAEIQKLNSDLDKFINGKGV